MNPRFGNPAEAVFLLFKLTLNVLFELIAFYGVFLLFKLTLSVLLRLVSFIAFSSNPFTAIPLAALSFYCALPTLILLHASLSKSTGRYGLPFLKHLAQITGIQKIWEAIKAFSQKEDALLQAISSGDLEKVERFLEFSVIQKRAHANNNAALCSAAAKGYTAIVKRLLNIPAVQATAHANENEALRQAAYRGHVDIALQLLDIQAVRENAHACNNGALAAAAGSGFSDIVEELLAIPAVYDNAHALHNNALYQATCKGHADIVRLLLRVSEVCNHAPDKDNALLRIAVRNIPRDKNYEEIVNLFLTVKQVRNSVPTDLLTHPVIQKHLKEQANACVLPEKYHPMRDIFTQELSQETVLGSSFAVTRTQEGETLDKQCNHPCLSE